MLLKYFFDILCGAQTSSNETTYCPVCAHVGAGFSPLPDFYRENAERYGYAQFGQGEMTSLETYFCNNCSASDRERLYAYWIMKQVANNAFPMNTSFIHFAPENALSKRLKKIDLFAYKTADLSMVNVDYQVNMMAMPFEDQSFGFFLCSHVLEHVESDDQAISELYRITKHGGAGILMAPVIVGLKKTVEDSSVRDEAGRWRLFGQNDHVRLYAHGDYVKKIRSHGFHVEELGEKYFGKKLFASLGLKRTSILYVVSK